MSSTNQCILVQIRKHNIHQQHMINLNILSHPNKHFIFKCQIVKFQDNRYLDMFSM